MHLAIRVWGRSSVAHGCDGKAFESSEQPAGVVNSRSCLLASTMLSAVLERKSARFVSAVKERGSKQFQRLWMSCIEEGIIEERATHLPYGSE